MVDMNENEQAKHNLKLKKWELISAVFFPAIEDFPILTIDIEYYLMMPYRLSEAS